ncbi:MAG: hypothetical protein U0931_40255 [Vulcanimicrobiota bacterium]
MKIAANPPTQAGQSVRRNQKAESAGSQEPQDSLVFQLPQGATEVHGHLASDPGHALCPSTQYPLRTYMLTDTNQVAAVDFRDLFNSLKARAYPSQNYKITQKRLDKVVEKSTQEREARLQGAPGAGLRATPKDNSLNPTTVTMFSDDLNEVSGVYAQQMAQIGQVEGFQVVLAGHADRIKDVEAELDRKRVKNISFMSLPEGEVWVEDYGEPLLQKGWVTPAIFEGDWIRTAIDEGRQQRFPKDVPSDFGQLGQVHACQLQPTALGQAAALGGKAVQGMAYLEGGNTLTGTRPDGQPYALVGQDSLAVSKRLLDAKSDLQVREAVASDLGVPASAVFPVEQPGEFHLDMRMMPIAPGEIALNDAKAAAEQQIKWLRSELDQAIKDGGAADELRQQFKERSQNLREEAEKRAQYEALTTRDLEAAGMKVHHLPGVFVDPDYPASDTSNFFNARHGVNEQGERFSIFMGGKPEEEAFVAEKLLNAGVGLTRLHFLDPSQTASTLNLQGGLKCRTKPDGELVPQAELNHPVETRLSA